MTKTKKRIFVSALASLLLVLTVFFGFGAMEASAATVTTPVRTTYGNYTYDGSTYSGYPSSYFKVTMHGASTSGTSTMYNDELTSWTWYYIKVVDVDIRKHVSFKLYRNNSLYSSKSLEDDGDLTLYSGSLPDGEYRLEYVCNIGNLFSNRDYTYTYRFEVDKTAPTATLKAGGSTISDGAYTNKQVVYSATDSNTVRIRVMSPSASSYATSYNSSYTVAATSANNGWWYLYALDPMDNSTSAKSFYMDTVAPVGKVTNANGSTISNGGYTNSAVKYTATDTGGVSYLQVKTPGSSSWSSYTSGTSLSSAYGWYTFRAVDKAGNISTEYKVYYDAGVPTGTLYGGTTSKSSGSYTNASYVKYTASDSYSGIANIYVRMPNSSYYTAYSSGTQLATQGTYYFYCVDKSGNTSSTVSITLDTSKPTGTLYGGTSVISSGGSTNASYIRFVPSDNIGLSTTYVKKPGASSYVVYTSGTQFTAEGTYSFYSTDLAGNSSSTYTIILDRQIPTAQLYVDGKPIDNYSYTNGEHISFECDENCFVKLPDSETYVEYLSGVEYYKPGRYVFYGVSDAGNNTGYFTITIDRTVKTVNISNLTDGNTNGDVQITWTDGDATLYAPIKSVTINGESYTKGEVVYTIDTGVYKVVVTDRAGNTWSTEFSSTKKNIMTDTLQKEYYEINDADGEFFAFASYESALGFAKARENGFVRKGEWKSESWDTGIAMDAIDAANAVNGEYFIYKKSGNPDEWVAYFTVERLNQVIEEYAKVGIESYYYWEKAPATIADGENLFAYSDSKNILANSVTLGDNIGATINGEEIVDTVFATEGKHLLIVSDDWGNTCEYNLTIVRVTPDIHYVVGEGNDNTVTFDRVYHFKDQVTVSISDGFDEMAMFSVYDEEGNLLGHFSIGETFILTESGTYTVESVNHAGVSEEFNLIISRNAPKVEISENTDDKQLIIEIIKSADDESHIQTLEIYKSTDGGNTWVLVEKDDYGTAVSLENLTYKFRTTGIYKATITDEFRTGIDEVTAQHDYVQENPTGTLNGVVNNGYTNGTVTFEWDDEAIVVLTKDGTVVEYASGDELTEDGVYTLTFENFDGYKASYTFTIDKAAPVIATEGANHKESVNEDVKVFYTEENLKAEIFKNGKSLGDYTSGNPVSADGIYRIVISDLAGNKVEVEFTIDKTVDFAINVNDNGLSNSVIATANETVTVTLLKNGEKIDYVLGSAISVPAEYTLAITDALGNHEEISFKVVESLVKEFTHNFDDVEGFGGVTVNGEDRRLNYGTLELKEDGVYEVGVIVSGNTYLFKVTVDGTAPTIALDGVENGGSTKDAVTISNPSEDATVKVTLNGEPVEYTLGDEITEPGEYRVTVTDEIGNTAEYSFTVEKTISVGAIIGIILGVLGVIGVVVIIILKKKEII